MSKIMSAHEAVECIKNGDCIAVNSFLTLSNPKFLHDALYERFMQTGSPKNLSIFCPASMSTFADHYIEAGAVKEIIASHYSSMPAVAQAASQNKIEGYCLPLGMLSHSLRAAASGKDWILSEVGIGIFADPRVDTCAVNDISKKEMVKVKEIEGKEYLLFHTPKIDVAFIKGTSVDPNGNITFENEYLTLDALAMAQATKRNGGKVIVQVDRASQEFSRPRNVIIPAALVDSICICQPISAHNPILSGEAHVPIEDMSCYFNKVASKDSEDKTADIIGQRAAKELCAGQIVNIGIGIPERVGECAAKQRVIEDITFTVEPGGIGGIPASGKDFGATIGADMICDMSTQFDFYDGGGLDICFLGGLEADVAGNVSVHKREGGYVGIGGFANITHATKTIVFCMSFTAKGLIATKENDEVIIKQEGTVAKFKKEISAISFSLSSFQLFDKF